MRNAEDVKLTGLKECLGTNPGAEYRMSPGALIRFLGERAGSVEEAVALAKTVDVHSLKSGTLDWNAGIYIADATGKYGIWNSWTISLSGFPASSCSRISSCPAAIAIARSTVRASAAMRRSKPGVMPCRRKKI